MCCPCLTTKQLDVCLRSGSNTELHATLDQIAGPLSCLSQAWFSTRFEFKLRCTTCKFLGQFDPGSNSIAIQNCPSSITGVTLNSGSCHYLKGSLGRWSLSRGAHTSTAHQTPRRLPRFRSIHSASLSLQNRITSVCPVFLCWVFLRFSLSSNFL